MAVAEIATSTFFMTSLRPEARTKRLPKCFYMQKVEGTGGFQWKAMNTQTPLSSNHTSVTSKAREGLAIFTEKQKPAFKKKPKHSCENMVVINFGSGRYLPNSAIFRQYYSIRAYEIGATGKISLETLMNLLQETGINSVKGMGLHVDMMGSTPEMRKRDLIWVAAKVQVVIDSYPSREDIVQVDNWSTVAGKNCMRRDALFRDRRTGETLVRASSIWVTMNTKTRRVDRIPEEVRAEVGPYLIDVPPIVEDDNKQVVELDESTAGYICPDLKPRRSDLDFNQHVNNAKYIGWILESMPRLLLENCELSCMTMEYKRECHKDNIIRSLTDVTSGGGGCFVDPRGIECCHMLKLDSGPEIMRARSHWRPKATTFS